jgi:hypothetical protein
MAAFDDTDHHVDECDVAGWEYQMNGEDDEVIPVLYSELSDPSPAQQWHFDRWFDNTYYGLDEATAAQAKPGGGPTD